MRFFRFSVGESPGKKQNNGVIFTGVLENPKNLHFVGSAVIRFTQFVCKKPVLGLINYSVLASVIRLRSLFERFLKTRN